MNKKIFIILIPVITILVMILGMIFQITRCPLPQSRPIYNLIIKIKPDSGWAYKQLAKTYFMAKKYGWAGRYFTKAIALNPKDFEAFTYLGFLYGPFDSLASLGAFSEALKINPDYLPAIRSRGILYSEHKEYQKAIDDFTHFIKIKANSADIYYYRSLVYKALGQTDNYAKDYERAAQLDKKYAHSYAIGLGGWKVPKPDSGYNKQLDYYTGLIASNPNDIESWNSRAKLWMSLGKFDKAIEDFTQTVKINPNFARGYNNRGACFYSKKEYARAIEDYNKAIELAPNFVMPYSNMGNAYKDQGQYKEAIEWFKRAMQIDPNFPDTYFNCGIAYRDMGMFKEAVQCWEKCIKLNPASAGMLGAEIKQARMTEKEAL